MVRATTTTDVRRLTPAAVLLRRRGLLYVPGPTGTPTASDPAVVVGVTLLEADLLELGVLMRAALRHRLEHTDPATLTVTGQRLLAEVRASLGADRQMKPLFRRFPDSVPRDTLALWVDRVLTLLAQNPDQPCVLCGDSGSVHPVAPCAHLVCRSCFDGADYTACPICYRALDPADPFLQPHPAQARPSRTRLPWRARVIGAGDDILADAHAEVAALLKRPSALSPQDRDDLLALLATHDRGDLAWLPDQVPSRETNALVLSWLLDAPDQWSTAPPGGAAAPAHRDPARLGVDGLLRLPRPGAARRGCAVARGRPRPYGHPAPQPYDPDRIHPPPGRDRSVLCGATGRGHRAGPDGAGPGPGRAGHPVPGGCPGGGGRHRPRAPARRPGPRGRTPAGDRRPRGQPRR
ncbi:MAG: hypothetical protein IRY85_15590, partial [Micromonosporaceae bacterium]|nr:hypothetical protein [Micromonosporaceae bacterium]